jgi:hypothetical protein
VLARLPTSRAKNDFGIELYRIYRGEIFISSRRELKKFPDLARGGGRKERIETSLAILRAI